MGEEMPRSNLASCNTRSMRGILNTHAYNDVLPRADPVGADVVSQYFKTWKTLSHPQLQELRMILRLRLAWGCRLGESARCGARTLLGGTRSLS